MNPKRRITRVTVISSARHKQSSTLNRGDPIADPNMTREQNADDLNHRIGSIFLLSRLFCRKPVPTFGARCFVVGYQ